jgi:MSHA biogenesis protein MshJ
MKQHWENLIKKVDGLSLRERALTFAAAAAILIALTKTLFLDPLLVEKNKKSTQLVQQQEKMKAVQAQIDASSQARKDIENSPLHQRVEQATQQLADGDVYLQGLSDRLVAPEKMAELLEQVLNKYGRLQLINMHTLPVAPLTMEKPGTTAVLDKQIFKHGVQMTVRGSYLDLLQYLTELEQLPTQMFWGKVDMKVEKYPEVVLTLTVYTLSLDKTWLKI